MTERFLIAGSGGMLGTALQQVLSERGDSFVAPSEAEFDITDVNTVSSVVAAFAEAGGPGALLNAAAYTNVERAEDDSATAYAVNETGARLLAEAACEYGLGFVHVSTDFVFDGEKAGAYTEQDEPHPVSVYGASKLAGERAVLGACAEALIVRTAWVFGPNGVNFPVKILRRARESGRLSVVTDEVGSPTYTIDLARGILGLVDAGVTGLYHLAGAGACSRFEMAQEVMRLTGIDVEVAPVTSDAFPSKVHRPRNSILDCAKAADAGVSMPEWHDSLARFLAEYSSAEEG